MKYRHIFILLLATGLFWNCFALASPSSDFWKMNPFVQQSQEELNDELFSAISCRDATRVNEAIVNGADVNALKGKLSPLMVAGQYFYDHEVFQALINGGANVNAKTDTGMTVLMSIAAHKGLASAETDFTPRGTSNFTFTALANAAQDEYNQEVLDTLRELLDAGAGDTIDSKDEQGRTALMIAVCYQSGPALYGIAKLLLEFRADPNIKDNLHRFPLLIAALHGDSDTVFLLLENGAHKSLTDLNGVTTSRNLRVSKKIRDLINDYDGYSVKRR